VPTTRPRVQITVTKELEQALDAAAERWPEDADRRGRLVVQLIEAGHQAISRQAPAEPKRRAKRTIAIERSRGEFADCFPSGYLQREREGWRE
jgi:hypothetical protein